RSAARTETQPVGELVLWPLAQNAASALGLPARRDDCTPRASTLRSRRLAAALAGTRRRLDSAPGLSSACGPIVSGRVEAPRAAIGGGGSIMSGAREGFLETVRKAVHAGNQAGHAAPLPERGSVGYQGAGANPSERFAAQLQAAGGL